MKKNLLPIFLFTLLFNITQGQTAQENWLPYLNNGSILIEYREVDYQEPNTDISKTLIVFKITNLTANKISLEWSQELQYGSKCYNCDGNNKEMHFKISIDPYLFFEANPDTQENNGLVIFSKFNSPEIMKNKNSELTNFELKDIQALSIMD